MTKLAKNLNTLKREWLYPREAIHRGQRCPFLLKTSFATEAVDSENINHLPFAIPNDLGEFWLTNRSATLFKDEQYGQWGIEIFDPARAMTETQHQTAMRPKDFVSSDLVIGRFLGDSDLLVISCDPQRDFGTLTIACPLDRRSEWPTPAESFSTFLERLIDAQGDKYWEIRK